MLIEFAPVVLNLIIQFLSLNQYNLIFAQESQLFSDSTFHISGYKTLRKARSMMRRGTTNCTGNLGGGVLILVKNGLINSLSLYPHLCSLYPCSDYLAITVKKRKPLLRTFSISMSLLSALLLLTPFLNPSPSPLNFILSYYLYFWRF